MSAPIEFVFREAIAFLQSGRLEAAERGLRKVLRQQPRHIATLNLLSVVLSQLKRHAEAEPYIKTALQLDASSDATFYNYGLVLKALQRPAEALQRFDGALAINPAIADSWNGRGTVLNDLKRYAEAILAFDRAVALRPNYAEAIVNKANALLGLRQYGDACATYDQALAINPRLAEAWLGRGRAFIELARERDAEEAYGRALALKPDWPEALCALARLLLQNGDIAQATRLSCRALAVQETFETKATVAACLQSPLLQPDAGDIRSILERAISEAWVRPSTLAPACATFLVLNDALRSGMARLADPDVRSQPAETILASSEIAAFAGDSLLRNVLQATPVSSPLLEKFATELRFVLLSVAYGASSAAVPSAVLTLFSAVARQCFINSYVFALSATEAEHVESLRSDVAARLASGAAVSALSLLAIASYMPLHALANPERLLDRRWPGSVSAVLDQQIRAWQEERRLSSLMPALTPVEDDVSLQVRSHYEEHPYPQWLAAEPVGPSTTLDAFLSEQFPDSSFMPGGKEGAIDILVAGCGTGRSAIHAAQRFRDAQVLAIDLSLKSLSYAQRQARALGIRNLRHAHADIMKLSSIGHTFEMIELSGVLHHLADPFAAWRILVSLLKPGGVMQIALYSEMARRDIVAARAFIAERGYRPVPADIRLCRQELLACEDGTPLRNVTLTSDFYSLSDCRDLLFHGQEHRMTLPQIERFLSDNDLRFLGFDIDAATKRKYRQRCPADIAMTDLGSWHVFETENPYTFISMYQFWVQKM